MGGGSGTNTTVTSSFPKWTEAAHRKLVGTAEEFGYGTDYPAYTESRIAGFDPAQQESCYATGDLYNQGDQWGGYVGGEMNAA